MPLKFTFLFFFLILVSKAQIVNAYANVTALSANTFTVNNVDETNHTFEDGDYIIMMQMQDNCIGSNTTNVSTFGDLGSIQSAGLFEVLRISTHTESAGLPNVIVLTTTPVNTYNIGANSSVQIISFRLYGSPNYTTLANATAKNWNGTTGGVLAIQVNGTLTLAHNFTANGSGFRGGAVSANFYSGGMGCTTTEYIRTTNHTRAGAKGEGIYRTTNNDFLYARGHLLNGGGGGSERINCGGGGGGNYTIGGDGGNGWSCPAAGGGGLGGISLAGQITSSRIFMGGGGGGGQQNDGQGTAGGNGGGIVLIKANRIITQGACGGLVISANGNTVTGLTNDGQGGGGAAGTVLIQTNSWGIAASCPLSIRANGGTGGTANTSAHAGGGGGAQGVVIYSTAQPTANVTTATTNGAAGCNDNSSPCTNFAGSPSGSNNSGTLTSAGSPLPIQLAFFEAYLNVEGGVELRWQTFSEIENDYFEVERSVDGVYWVTLGRINATGNSQVKIDYAYTDRSLYNELRYYRLKQVDKEKAISYSEIRVVQSNGQLVQAITLYPNPAKSKFTVEIDGTYKDESIHIELFSSLGIQVLNALYQGENSATKIELTPQPILSKGFYLCVITMGKKKYFERLLISE